MTSIQPLIRYLISEHLERIAAQSFQHCHTEGLHSIMLINSPEQTVRLFYATREHTLWRNAPASYGQGNMSVGFHTHHCNIMLHVILGRIGNWVVRQVEHRNGFIAQAYVWNSPIKGQEGGFLRIEEDVRIETESFTMHYADQSATAIMAAQEMHTVYIPQGEEAAWFVYEGREDPAYQPITLSNQDLSAIDLSGLYKPMDMEQVVSILDHLGLLF